MEVIDFYLRKERMDTKRQKLKLRIKISKFNRNWEILLIGVGK